MRFVCHLISIFVLSISIGVAPAFGQTVNKKRVAARVKAEFLHAWNGYKQNCWGHDDLKPISKTCRDWYGTTILMTPVDSLDSLYLLGFKDEADKTREWRACRKAMQRCSARQPLRVHRAKVSESSYGVARPNADGQARRAEDVWLGIGA